MRVILGGAPDPADASRCGTAGGSGAASPAGYVRASRRVRIEILQPVAAGEVCVVVGELLGAMHDRGAVLHYRVAVGGGVVLFSPPAWLHPDSLDVVATAGLSVPGEGDRGVGMASLQSLRGSWPSEGGRRLACSAVHAGGAP